MKVPETPYNYCDYRCEKCPWTEHCTVYQQEISDHLMLMAEGIDPDSWEGTLKVVQRNFEEVHNMLEEDAKRFGIDLNVPLEPLPKPPETELEKRAESCAFRLHHLSKKIVASESFIHLENILHEAFEDLMWNNLLFAVKLKRAMHGIWNYQNETDVDFREAALSDAIKSAGVSIRAMETSQQALSILADKISSMEKEIRKEIRELEEIQKQLEETIRKYQK